MTKEEDDVISLRKAIESMMKEWGYDTRYIITTDENSITIKAKEHIIAGCFVRDVLAILPNGALWYFNANKENHPEMVIHGIYL